MKPKYSQLVRQLEELVLSGRFRPGERIPSERELLSECDASYMTLRRALNELSERGVIVRMGAKGSFLSPDALRLVGVKKVNFIYSTWEGPFFAELLQAAVAVIEKNGYLASVIHFQEAFTNKIKASLEQGEAAILYGIDGNRYPESFGTMLRAAQQAGAPLVVIGSDYNSTGIYGIRADDAAAMRLALDCLSSCGHRRIMLATPADYLNLPHYQRVSEWFDYARRQNYLDRRLEYLITFNDSRGGLYHFRDVLTAALVGRPADATALICMDHAILMATLSAAWELKLRVPEDISVVVIGDTVLSDFSQPPITGVSVNLRRHMELAMQMVIDHEMRREQPTHTLIVSPELVCRASVARVIAE